MEFGSVLLPGGSSVLETTSPPTGKILPLDSLPKFSSHSGAARSLTVRVTVLASPSLVTTLVVTDFVPWRRVGKGGGKELKAGALPDGTGGAGTNSSPADLILGGGAGLAKYEGVHAEGVQQPSSESNPSKTDRPRFTSICGATVVWADAISDVTIMPLLEPAR